MQHWELDMAVAYEHYQEQFHSRYIGSSDDQSISLDQLGAETEVAEEQQTNCRVLIYLVLSRDLPLPFDFFIFTCIFTCIVR